MPRRIPTEQLVKVQTDPANIRNVSILAHVDHGKTTLADSLISSNGIISSRSITDQIRYMDSREDEQLRGITMKTSSITLHHQKNEKEHVINLIDSPGHIDFSSEVSTAVRLSDGCLVVVDVVEGVCPQTKAVLRQAWIERLKPVLVLNKIDRLIGEKKLSPLETYQRLNQVLEQVNASIALLIASDAMRESEEKRIKKKRQADPSHINLDDDYVVINDEGRYFAPEMGNVIFASAIHGWAFTVPHFARLYHTKFGTSVPILSKTLFGDYYVNVKQKRFCIGAVDKGKEPLFCKLILSYLFEIYEHVENKNKDKCIQFAKRIGVKLYPRDEKAIMSSPDSFLLSLMSQWLPLSDTVLSTVIEQIPSPAAIGPERIKALLRSNHNKRNSATTAASEEACQAIFEQCSPTSDDRVFFVSKMLSLQRRELPQNRRGPLTMDEIKARRAEVERLKLADQEPPEALAHEKVEEEAKKEDNDEIVFVAVGRVFSGTMRKGDKIRALGAKYTAGSENHSEEIEIGDIYLLMGRDLLLVESAPAGAIVGIGGIHSRDGGVIINTGTLTSTPLVPAFSPIYADAIPILRVAVEPTDLSNMSRLRDGCRLLNVADPCVEIVASQTGELIIAACGEVHMQKCLDDLERDYAKCKVVRSDPVVPFRETLITPPKVDRVGEAFGEQERHFMRKFDEDEKNEEEEGENEDGEEMEKREELIPDETTIKLYSANRQTKIVLQAFPLPDPVRLFLEANEPSLTLINAKKMDELDVAKFKSQLMEVFKRTDFPQPAQLVDSIIMLGPNGAGPNILVNEIPTYQERSNYWSMNFSNLKQFDHQLLSGFQLATQSGPLCEEPMSGVGFRLLEWEVFSEKEHFNSTVTSGQLISTMKEACRKVYLTGHKRLLAAMYQCPIQATSDVLGKLYGVISKRNGKVLDDDMIEGTNLFQITAELPVIESFGFVDDVRKKTSGLAFPQLRFSHWGLVEGDPLWVPTTEEEVQHFGEKADYESISRKYMNAIRKRKGLWVDEKIVEHGDKQRTITRNK